MKRVLISSDILVELSFICKEKTKLVKTKPLWAMKKRTVEGQRKPFRIVRI